MEKILAEHAADRTIVVVPTELNGPPAVVGLARSAGVLRVRRVAVARARAVLAADLLREIKAPGKGPSWRRRPAARRLVRDVREERGHLSLPVVRGALARERRKGLGSGHEVTIGIEGVPVREHGRIRCLAEDGVEPARRAARARGATGAAAAARAGGAACPCRAAAARARRALARVRRVRALVAAAGAATGSGRGGEEQADMAREAPRV